MKPSLAEALFARIEILSMEALLLLVVSVTPFLVTVPLMAASKELFLLVVDVKVEASEEE